MMNVIAKKKTITTKNAVATKKKTSGKINTLATVITKTITITHKKEVAEFALASDVGNEKGSQLTTNT